LEPGAGRCGIESADGRNAIFFTGRLHLDAGDYLDYRPASRFAAVQDLNSGVNARRARLGIVGRFGGDWDYTFIYDLGGSAGGFPPDPGAGASGLENALVTYSGLKNHGVVPLVFDLGYMDVPFTQGEGGSVRTTSRLVERAAIVNVVAPIMANDFRSAFGARSFTGRYWAGAYVTGPNSGSNHTTGEPLGAVGRAGYNLWYSPEGFFHLEGDVGAQLKPPAPGGIRTITLSERPELRVDPTSILSTGALGTAANPLNNVEAYGGGGIVEWRNFLVDGEAYQVNANRQGLATNSFEGGYIEAMWTLTGEQRKYSPPSGGYLRPVPDHPFLPFNGSCCGAFELAARYSTVDLNNNFQPAAPARKQFRRRRPTDGLRRRAELVSEREYAVHVRLPARQDQQTLLDRGGRRHSGNASRHPGGRSV
jgi:phosphate-selective porin OprO/OprP